MKRRIAVIGAGFAGVWSALAAQRLVNEKEKADEVEIVMIAPQPTLVIRPRLYEASPTAMVHSLSALFQAAGISIVQGYVRTINTMEHLLYIRSATGPDFTVGYDRVILAAGSNVSRPPSIKGLQQHSFDIDSLETASKLEAHLKGLARLSPSSARDTVIICGAGFTGIELATELPKRLSQQRVNARIVLLDSSEQVGSTLGPQLRPVIQSALKHHGIEVKLGCTVTEVDAAGIRLANGERIESLTVIWTAGVKANSLTEHISGTKDAFGRLQVDENLRVLSCGDVFATGDTASVLADSKGHQALMSCQHALVLGRISGHNAAADLLGEPNVTYSQPAYNCCLDLGGWGAVIAGGWDRNVWVIGDTAKRVKAYINQTLIYPPDDIANALSMAGPDVPDSDELFHQILDAVGKLDVIQAT